MKAALIQMAPRLFEAAANRERALALMAAAAADLYVLPELFSSGYTFAHPSEVARVAEPAAAGPTCAAMAAFAHRQNCSVIYGFAEAGEDGRFYNAANIVGPQGWLGTYRKMHLFAREKLFFAPGDAAAPVFNLPCGRVGVMICFDWYFPEVTRSLALRGAEIVAHPSNLVLPHCPQAMITRSLENRIYTLTCDRVGGERNGAIHYDFIGSSQAVTPKGEILTRLSRDREEVGLVELDAAAARGKALGELNDLWADRRPELYH